MATEEEQNVREPTFEIKTRIPFIPEVAVDEGTNARSLQVRDIITEDSYTTTFEVFRTRGTYIGYDQAFGGTISDRDRFFYSLREPAGYWWVSLIADDIWDNWFRVIDVDDPDDDSLDKVVQPILERLKAKIEFPRETTFERRTGTAILLLSYTGFGTEIDWETPLWEDDFPPKTLPNEKKLLQITPFPWTAVIGIPAEDDEGSLRHGWPEFYKVSRGSTSLDQGALGTTGTTAAGVINVHWTRIIHDAPRLDQHPYEGVPVLDVIFDALVGGRNMFWGMCETYYRHGSGFPKITTNATKAENEAWVTAGGIVELMARSYFICGPEEDIEFVGAEGSALNPLSYFDTYFTFLATATGVSKNSIQGVSAGRVTGSESDERKYFKSITQQQKKKEPMLRELLNRLIQTGQIDFDGEYIIEWIDPFEVNPQDKAAIDFMEKRTANLMLSFMTVNEVRAANGLKSLDGWDIIMPQPGQSPVTAGTPNQEEPVPPTTEPEESEQTEGRLLDRAIKASD